MNMFVSYTTRNEEVTIKMLLNFSEKISFFGKTFIDLIDNNSQDKQGRIIEELQKANLLILINSQSVSSSKWVKFELNVAHSLKIPIIKFDITEIGNLTEQEIRIRLCSVVCIPQTHTVERLVL